jgi:hypothetical protein
MNKWQERLKGQTTRATQSALLAQRRAHMSNVDATYPTEFPGGSMTVVSYDPLTDRYTSVSGLTWQLVDGVMIVPEECKKI